MSYSSEYLKLRQKRKKETETTQKSATSKPKTNSSYADEYLSLRAKRTETTQNDDFAPVRSDTYDTEKSKFLNRYKRELDKAEDDLKHYRFHNAFGGNSQYPHYQRALRDINSKYANGDFDAYTARKTKAAEAAKKKYENGKKKYLEEYAKELESAEKNASKEKDALGKSPYDSIVADIHFRYHNGNYDEYLAAQARHEARREAKEKQEAKEKKRTWFSKGLLEDGYDKWDVTKTVIGTAGDVLTNFSEGVLNIPEAVIDVAAYGVGTVGGIVSEDFQDDVGKFIATDLLTMGEMNEAWDDYSFLGERTDSLVQTVPDLAAQYAGEYFGVPWQVTSGVMSFGRGVEGALQNGASYGQAGLQGAVDAAVEIGTEYLMGNSILGEKGLIDSSMFTKGISNKALKSRADFGIEVIGEGIEEPLSAFGSRLGESLIYKDGDIGENLFGEEAREEYYESAVGGSLLGGATKGGKVKKSIKNKTDYHTGFTAEDQKVFDKLQKDAVAEQEKSGKKASSKDKRQIYDNVMERVRQGDVSIDTIEEVLGGEMYQEYKNITEQKNALTDEISQLENTPEAQITVKQRERLNSARIDLQGITEKFNSIKSKLSDAVSSVAKNGVLAEAYNEKARRGQAFSVDLEQYDEKEKATYERAMQSGVLNNTNKSHAFVSSIAKIEAAKGITFDFVDNAKLKESGFALEGKTVNGFAQGGKITVNVQSAKSWQSVVGHEISHVLEGTEHYTELRNTLFEYAKKKGEFETRKADLTELYKNIDADIDAELTADLVGDYLFSDKNFIRNLTSNRNLFQKVYDEVKYLCKVATGKEKADIEKVKHEFDKVWKEFSAEGVKKESAKTNYSVSADSQKTDSVYLKIAESGNTEIAQKMVDDAAKNAGYDIKAYHGTGYDFTVFDKSRQGDNYQDWGRLGKGFYFAPTSREAETWAELSKGAKNKVMPVYLRSENMLDSFEALPDNLKDTIPENWDSLTRRLAEKYAYNYIEYMQEFGYNVQEILTAKGYDGINGHTEFVVFDPEQVKSADAVTYDDKGNTIPLSQRFNKANEDIRFSLSENPLDKKQNLEYNGTRGEGYVATDEFRNLQAECQGMSDEDIQLYHSGNKQIDDGLRTNLTRILRTQISTYRNGLRYDDGVLSLTNKGNEFNMCKAVDGSLFHDVFEIAQKYLRNGELVDLHTVETTNDGIGYNDCYNYLSEDGLSGFSITPEGDLISVFNSSGKGGFLGAIAPVVKEKAKTLDCYNSPNQPLRGMYEKVFGFKTASIMDYNMEYDHDNIAENHGMPQIAFMVNTESDIETREFTKDQYDEAVTYRNGFIMSEKIAPVKGSLSKQGEQLAPVGNYSTPLYETALAPLREEAIRNAETKAAKITDAPVVENTTEKGEEKGNFVDVVKVGDFYEIRGEKALQVADDLELQVTYKTIDGKRVPLVGFPLRYLDTYNKKANKKGYTLRSEQPENFGATTPAITDAPMLKDIPVLPDEKLEQGTIAAIRPKPTKQPSMKKVENFNAETVGAKVLTEMPKVEKKKTGIISKAISNFIDKGAVFENLSLKTKNRTLQDKYKAIGRSDTKAQYFMENGKGNVKSLDSIREEVEKAGKTQDFYNYIYHKHNIDRMSLESKERPNLIRLTGEMKKLKLLNLQENQLRAIASEKITKDTPQKRVNTIKTVREYLASLDVKNKPIFDYSVTAEMSQNIVTEYETQNPEFKEYAQDVYNYMNHLRSLLVENGVISQETADKWAEVYPYYVPIHRVDANGNAVNVPLDTNKTGINAPIKRATGGNSDILPLFNTMAERTIQTFKAIDKNRFGVELKNTLGGAVESTKTSIDEVIDSVDAQDSLLQEGKNGKNPTFTVFENGERVTFEITNEMYDALKPTSEALAYTNKVLNTASNIQRGLLTEYSVPFMVSNAVKDAQDVLINSQHPAKTYANFPKAIKELTTNGKWYTEYMENGGGDNTYFDKQTSDFNKDKSRLRKIVGFPLDKISGANNFIEKVPRLAEYIASRENGASIESAMLDAARITTDFSAGGDVTKFLNRNGATFLNASVQGFAQQVRNVREAKAKGLKGWLGLAAKYAIAGLPAILLNHALWDDDEEYQELSDYVKDNYYIVGKYGDGKFVRIPKGRVAAVIQNGFEQVGNTLTGDDEVDFDRFFELCMSNLAPNNPIDNNIFAPIAQVKTNKTWYGEDLVPTRLQDLPAAEQYDESTDSISKWLGETFDISPYKTNYLINQYSGGIGDIFLPMLTPEAESGDNSLGGNIIAPLKDKFTTDGVMNNQNVSDFYDTVDNLTTNAKSSYATDEDILMSKYINSVNTELGDLYKEKREIQNSDLSDSRKYKKVRDIQEQINELAKNALDSYEDVNIQDGYATVGDKHYRMDNGTWTKISDKQLQRQQEVTSRLGISPSEYWRKTEISFFPKNDGEYEYAYDNPEKYAVSKAVGGYDTYKSYSKELYNIKADKDSNGKTISGSKKEKVVDYINNLDLDYGQKIILYRSLYDSKEDKQNYNADIVEYLNNRDDLTYEERVTIFKELGFTVEGDSVYWD